MNESEWWSWDDPEPMLVCVKNEVSARKLRLFACACCRQAWNEFVPPLVVAVVELAEAFADNQIGESVLARVQSTMTRHADAATRSAGHGLTSYGYPALICRAAAAVATPNPRDAAHRTGLLAAHAVNDSAPWGFYLGDLQRGLHGREFDAELAEQAELARDIFGNPFRPVEVDPAWLTSDVLALARGVYEDRAFDRMPILADALQDAGCDNGDVLIHCRDASAIHARGCWVVDLLLSKS
jgi:hypothetical protein